MKKKSSKILLKAEKILTSAKDKTSIYYKELEKSYKEYIELDNKDKTTNDLYEMHIAKLCDFINENNNANISIAIMIVIFIWMVGLTTYSTLKYYDIVNNLKKDIIKTNNKASLVINYHNLDNFQISVLNDIDEHDELEPIELSIGALNDNNKKMRYNIYIVEQNDNIKTNDLLDRSLFVYNVRTQDTVGSINYIKNAIIENDRILIYSSIISDGEVDNIELRMWLDKNNVDFLNKKYNFTLYVDGYEI